MKNSKKIFSVLVLALGIFLVMPKTEAYAAPTVTHYEMAGMVDQDMYTQSTFKSYSYNQVETEGAEYKKLIKPEIKRKVLKNINESRMAKDSSNYHKSAKIGADIYAKNNNWMDKSGNIIWPPDRGFDGKSVNQVLKLGTRVDRYGFEGGTFVSPEGTPYPSRSLAPGTNKKPYYVYEVIKPVEVQAGKIASWFGEPGGGIQYELSQSVKKLIEGGYLRRVELK